MINRVTIPFVMPATSEYPSGLRHIIFNSATPIDDGNIQLVRPQPIAAV